jgi:type VI secretion system secreted protein Hcp
MPIFMKVEGIDGDVTAAGHEKWIEVNSLQWGIGRGIGSPTGGDKEREASAPSISEVVVTKTTDIASPKLMEAALWGEGVKVDIDLCKTDKDKLEPYMQYTLEDTLVSGFSVSSGGDRPSESISLNFTKIIYTHIPQKDKNETGDPIKVGYDLGQAKTI